MHGPAYLLFLPTHTVKLRSERIIDIDSDDLPVSFTFIQESHDTKDLDLLDLTSVANLFTNLNDINRIVVTLGLGLRMLLVGIFPSLRIKFGHEAEYNMHVNTTHATYLGEGTIVPDVTLVGEAVADEAKLALLGVLLDGVVSILLADLYISNSHH